MQVEDHGSVAPERGLRLEIEALRCKESAAPHETPPGDAYKQLTDETGSTVNSSERLLVWESARLAVILPRHGDPEEWVRVRVCTDRGVPMLRRESAGGAVVIGPGCLNFALVLSLERRPWLNDVQYSYHWLLGRLAGVLGVGGMAVRSTDLAIRDRKFAGHAQRRLRRTLLHHGVLLYDSNDFDLDLVDALLREPPRRPAWRGNRTHREFLTNAPLAREAIVRRLGRLPAALERQAAEFQGPPA